MVNHGVRKRQLALAWVSSIIVVLLAVLGVFFLTKSIQRTRATAAMQLVAFPLPSQEVTLEDGRKVTVAVSLIVPEAAQGGVSYYLEHQGTTQIEQAIADLFAGKTQEELLQDAVRQIPLGVDIQYSLKKQVFNRYNKTPDGARQPIRLKGVYLYHFAESAPQSATQAA